MLFGILESQAPWHNPGHGRIPAYYKDWRARYERGEDMSIEDLCPIRLAA